MKSCRWKFSTGRQKFPVAQSGFFASVFTIQESGQTMVGSCRSHYLAVATPTEDGFLWVWIGTHAEYDKLLA